MFGTVILAKIGDIDKYKYSRYGTGFDRYGTFPVANGCGKNVIIFGVDMSSTVHIDSKKKGTFSWRSYTRIRWYNTNCRKKIFNQF